MDQVAVFVDAGYFFAQGSVSIWGERRNRADLVLDVQAAVSAFKQIAAEKSPGCRLLRVYWYDGAIGGARPTTDQAALASLDDLKLRLGFVNSAGQQKGVDSLIVTDMIELARLKSISDAVLMAGDEDLRVGVQIAQNYGVRVHLVGIAAPRFSQSPQLQQEADTTCEWDRAFIESLLSLRPLSPVAGGKLNPTAALDQQTSDGTLTAVGLEEAVEKFVGALDVSDLKGLAAYWQTDRGVPSDFDRRLLPICRAAIGHDLDQDEKKAARSQFQRCVKVRLAE